MLLFDIRVSLLRIDCDDILVVRLLQYILIQLVQLDRLAQYNQHALLVHNHVDKIVDYKEYFNHEENERFV